MPQGVQLSAEEIEDVAAALASDPHWNAAADRAGINQRTIRRYREHAETHTNVLSDLPAETDESCWQCEAVRQWTLARARARQTFIDAVHQAISVPDKDGRQDGKLALAMLKACWPQDFNDRVELTGAGGGPIQVEALKEEALLRAEAALEQLGLRALGEVSAKASPAGNAE